MEEKTSIVTWFSEEIFSTPILSSKRTYSGTGNGRNRCKTSPPKKLRKPEKIPSMIKKIKRNNKPYSHLIRHRTRNL